MQCQVCWHHCELKEGQIGSCRARINKDGVIVSLNYGQLVSLALDPIEKKPLARFMPGSYILSLGSFGCNMHCTFCQNYAISQMGAADLDSEYYSPEDILSLAQRDREQGNVGVAFTYNEPMIGYEYVRDTAKIIKQAGMVNVVVTNGCVEQPILAEVLPYIDAFNIDLKSFNPEFYRRMGGDLETVKSFITTAAAKSHVEVTTLVIPGENDSTEEMTALAQWLSKVDTDLTLHVTRFFPRYKMLDKDSTPVATVYKLAEIANKYLDNVYTGNC
jgi:pyruvate formate lyase activating enzyme